MKPLRLAIVVRRFWPLSDGIGRLLARLAVALSEKGVSVTILTARWHNQWPSSVPFYGLPLVRLSPPPEGGWSTFRYTRALARWLRARRDRFDVIYVSGLRHEADAAIAAAGGRLPVVLRADGVEPPHPGAAAAPMLRGRRARRLKLGGVSTLAPSRLIERVLNDAGVPAEKITRLADGVPLPPERTAGTRAAARAVLAEAGPTFDVPDWAPVAVSTSPVQSAEEVGTLVAAWSPIADRWPGARLWLAGEGSERRAVRERIDRRNLSSHVIPVGRFDAVEELLAAANLFVLPAARPDARLCLLEAMAAGLPAIAVDVPATRELLGDGREGLLAPPDDTGAWATAIGRMLGETGLAARLGEAAHRRASQFSLARMVDQHLTWWDPWGEAAPR